MDTSSFLVIEKAPHYESGDIISLDKANMVFGRESKHWKPDITFNNVFVSRKHFSISFEANSFYIKDLQSKHGTSVNGKILEPNIPEKLATNDKISFAKDLVIMSFSLRDFDETCELTPINLEEQEKKPNPPRLDPLKQNLILKNNCYALTEKEYKFIEILLQKKQFVSKDELTHYVWSERFTSNSIDSMVSSEEVNALIYRLRKKIPPTITIETIRGKGYELRT
ncbi:FHA domain-containing protein [Metabacillus bambusae]|uniref:Winged helix-turn-helix domain-containing protein n=1 Tax=Metabacillus bambusae TaxID=2795218 RepID=A0ABS3N5A2_9BACI|nr:FHA domain-containing protein [Metabacillus bambusae]MBO1513205.1 winged helix-turn-helix domain-containing protein [Metabacillus bambusae]